jgi:hypothetical protein
MALLGSCKAGDKDLESQQRQQQQKRAWQTGLDSVLTLGGEVPIGKLVELSPQENTQDVYANGEKVIEHKQAGSTDVLKPGYYRKVQRTVRLSGNEALAEYTANLTPDIVWPGNLIYANSVRGTTLQDISELNDYRTPGRVTMAVVNGASNLSRQISDYRFSEVTKKLNELIASSEGKFPANLSYNVHAVRTLGEAAYYLRIPENELRGDKRYKAFQDVKWDTNTFKAVISFSQDFFTLVYDDPNGGASGLFDTRLTPKELGSIQVGGNLSPISPPSPMDGASLQSLRRQNVSTGIERIWKVRYVPLSPTTMKSRKQAKIRIQKTRSHVVIFLTSRT